MPPGSHQGKGSDQEHKGGRKGRDRERKGKGKGKSPKGAGGKGKTKDGRLLQGKRSRDFTGRFRGNRAGRPDDRTPSSAEASPSTEPHGDALLAIRDAPATGLVDPRQAFPPAPPGLPQHLVVRPPSPGGSRRVDFALPPGNFNSPPPRRPRSPALRGGPRRAQLLPRGTSPRPGGRAGPQREASHSPRRAEAPGDGGASDGDTCRHQ